MRPVGEPCDGLANLQAFTIANLRTFVFVTSFVGRFVDDSTVLQASQVKHAHTAISTTAHKHIYASCTETDIKHLLVVRDQLCFGSKSGYVPYRASCVDAGGNDELGRHSVPVKRRQRCSMLRCLGVRQERKRCEFRQLGFPRVHGRRP